MTQLTSCADLDGQLLRLERLCRHVIVDERSGRPAARRGKHEQRTNDRRHHHQTTHQTVNKTGHVHDTSPTTKPAAESRRSRASPGGHAACQRPTRPVRSHRPRRRKREPPTRVRTRTRRPTRPATVGVRRPRRAHEVPERGSSSLGPPKRRDDRETFGRVVQRKPTTRNVPRAISPAASAAPTARPSPRLCSPIPAAMKYAASARQARHSRPVVQRALERDEADDSAPDAPIANRAEPVQSRPRLGRQLEPFVDRVDEKEREQTDREGEEEAEPASARPAAAPGTTAARPRPGSRRCRGRASA